MHLQRSSSILNSEVIETYLREGVSLRLHTLRKTEKELVSRAIRYVIFRRNSENTLNAERLITIRVTNCAGCLDYPPPTGGIIAKTQPSINTVDGPLSAEIGLSPTRI